jgi:anti-sigma regulatory factor (Ser/Thr protein kinase)
MPRADCVDIAVNTSGVLTYDEIGVHLRPTATGPVEIDLSGLKFIDPAGLVSLAVVAERAKLLGLPVLFRKPAGGDVANYLKRMRLGDQLEALDVAHDLPQVQERRLGHRLVELRRFDGEEGLDTVAATLVQTYVNDHPELVQPLYAALDEMARNVLEHSTRSHGYVALQRYDNRRDISFAVGDSGIGLRRRLAEVVPVPDDRTAIVRAAQVHVTSIGRPGRGRGISRVIGITGEHRGSVTLISGTASGTFQRGHLDPEVTEFAASYPGTLAHVRLSL